MPDRFEETPRLEIIGPGRLIVETLGWFGVIVLAQVAGVAVSVLSALAASRSAYYALEIPLWLGPGLTCCMLPCGAYRLAHNTLSTIWPIAYGAAGSLLYLPLLIFVFNCSGLPVSSLVTVVAIPAAVCFGLLCWGAAELHRGADEDLPECAEARMGIKHLILWTVCTAVYMGLLTTFSPGRELLPQGQQTFSRALLALGAIAGGGSIMGAVVFTARRTRGLGFPRHPGDYLLLAMGIQSLLALVMLSVPHGAVHHRPFMEIGDLLGVLILLIPARRSTTPLLWRTYFYLAIAAELLSFLAGSITRSTLSLYISTFGGLVPPLVLLLIVMRAGRDRQRYPWTHWFAVGIALWSTLCSVGWMIRYFLLQN